MYSFFNFMEVLNIANNNSNELPINENIRVPEVMVIGPNGEKMGLKKILCYLLNHLKMKYALK